MRYKIYTTSEKAWDAMLEAIKRAEKSIYLEMYIFLDTVKSHNFFDILIQKAKQGVKVKIVVDSFGSHKMSSEQIKGIKESGAELIFFSHWLQRTHKKILVVDEKVAFLGGVNIHEAFRKWNDLQIRLEGAVVKNILSSFARTYRLCGGKDQNVLSKEKAVIIRKAKIWFYEHWPSSKKGILKKRYLGEIRKARKKITISTPYFFPHRWLIAALHSATLRGAEVEVIAPQKSDYWIFSKVNHYYFCLLGRLGVKFYLTKEIIHAKAMLIDGEKGIIGSQNIDALSFDYNAEAGVFFTDKKMIADLGRIIESWKKEAVVFNSAEHQTHWDDRLLAPIIRLFQPIL